MNIPPGQAPALIIRIEDFSKNLRISSRGLIDKEIFAHEVSSAR